MEQHQEPGVRKFFKKILNSITWFLLWVTGCATAGIYFQLGYVRDVSPIRPILFYIAMVVSLFLLIRYLIRIWK